MALTQKEFDKIVEGANQQIKDYREEVFSRPRYYSDWEGEEEHDSNSVGLTERYMGAINSLLGTISLEHKCKFEKFNLRNLSG